MAEAGPAGDEVDEPAGGDRHIQVLFFQPRLGRRVKYVQNKDGNNLSIQEFSGIIRSTQSSIDICVQKLGKGILQEEVRKLINRERLPKVNINYIRIIKCTTSPNEDVDQQLRPIVRNARTGNNASSIMRHNFTVINRSIVITGGLDWTNDALYFHHGNVVIIRDEAIANQYLERFETIWNESQPIPVEDEQLNAAMAANQI